MDKSLSALSKALLGIMVVIVLVAGGVVIALRKLEKSIEPLRKAEYVARDKVETQSLIAHGYWVFSEFDNTDYLNAGQDAILQDVLNPTSPIYPDTDADPENYNAARYYSCNFNPEDGKGFYYWISFQEIEDAAKFCKYLNSLSLLYPFSVISDRYNRYYQDSSYDKGNRKAFCKIFGLPDPQDYSPVMVVAKSHRFDGEEIPGPGSDMDGLFVKSVDKDQLVLAYKDSKGNLDLIYKNMSSLPVKPLSYSVYFKGQ